MNYRVSYGPSELRTVIQETLIALTYEAEAIVLADVDFPLSRLQNFILKLNNKKMRYNLDMFE